MVCAQHFEKSSEKSSVKSGKISKKMKPVEQEMQALRNLVPGSSEKSDLDLVLNAITYIQSLEMKLKNHSSPALLKAQFLAIRRMNQRQIEA